MVCVFLYYTFAPWDLIGRTDPIGTEAGYELVAAHTLAQVQATGATWVATTVPSHLRDAALDAARPSAGDRDQRARPLPGRLRRSGSIRSAIMSASMSVREPENNLPLWSETSAVRQPLERVTRSWRGMVMDTYALEKISGWTPDLSPPPDTTFFRWRVLAFSLSARAGRGWDERGASARDGEGSDAEAPAHPESLGPALLPLNVVAQLRPRDS